MLKIIRLSEKLASRVFNNSNDEVIEGGNNKMIVNLFKNKKSRKSTHVPNIGATRESNFLIPDVKKAFNHLCLAFIKASIFQHFDLESHIRIKTNSSDYVIGRILS